jgi:serine O-acetyltransferase
VFENIRKDYVFTAKRNATILRVFLLFLFNAGFRAVVLYRMGRWCRLHHLGIIAKIIERIIHHACHCCISTEAEIGSGLRIAHVYGILIPRKVIIGKECTLRNNVMFGGNYDKVDSEGRSFPTIGDRVSFGPGCCILGPVTVGSNVIIGANAVVTTSIPDNSVAGAFRAEVIATLNEEGNLERTDKHVFFSRRLLYEKLADLEKRLKRLESETKN